MGLEGEDLPQRFATWFIALLMWCVPVWSQDSQRFNGKDHVRHESAWYLVEDGKPAFRLDERVFTVVPNRQVAKADRQTFHRRIQVAASPVNELGYMDVAVPEAGDVFSAARAYLESGFAKAVWLNYFGRYNGSLKSDENVPDDPRFTSQWHHDRVDSTDAWRLQWGGEEVIVAVLDSGLDLDHPDFGTFGEPFFAPWRNQGEEPWADPLDPTSGNGIDDDQNGYVDDWLGYNFFHGNNNTADINGHGTFVGGLIGAKTHNGIGVSGIAGGFGGGGVRLMIGSVGDASPSTAALDDAILYAINHGADIIQMSLTIPFSPPVEAAITNAYELHGIVLICSSGNDGQTVGYPARHPYVIAVGAADDQDARWSLASYGEELDLSAPGSSLISTDLDGYGVRSGTSFSAPLVSGCVALMLSHNPSLSPEQVRSILHETAEQVGIYDYAWNPDAPGHSKELGYGILDVAAALSASLGNDPDLFIRRFKWDTGREPAAYSEKYLLTSQDVWNCVDRPDCDKHQEPVAGIINFLRARVQNRSGTASQGGAMFLYWSIARNQNRWPDHWLHPDDPLNPGSNDVQGFPAGGQITVRPGQGFNSDPVLVPPLASGESVVLTRGWTPPNLSNLAESYSGQSLVIGLLARIVTQGDPIDGENFGPLGQNLIVSNNIAAKIEQKLAMEVCQSTHNNLLILLANTSRSTKTFDWTFIQEAGYEDFDGRVRLALWDPTWDTWPSDPNDIVGAIASENGHYVVLDPLAGATFKDIVMQPGEIRPLRILFDNGINRTPEKRDFLFSTTQIEAGTGEIQGVIPIRLQVPGDPLLERVEAWPQMNVLNLLDTICQPVEE